MRSKLLGFIFLMFVLSFSDRESAEASHCANHGGGGNNDFLTNCMQTGQRGGAGELGLGFDPTNLMNQEFNNRAFSTLTAGAVTNNPFGRIVDFDGNTSDGILTPDRGDHFYNSCLQGMIYPFEGRVGSNGCGAAVAPGMGNTAQPFIRDHEVVVGTLVRVVPDPFTQSPILVGECTGPGGTYSAANNDDNPCVNPNNPKDITEHAIFNFFVWNNSNATVKSELGGIFKISGCPPATTSGQTRVCSEQSIQQGSRAAVGPEGNSGNLELPISGNGSIFSTAVRFQSDGTPLEVDNSPSSLQVDYRNRVVQGIWEVDVAGAFFHNIPNGTGCTGNEAPNTVQCNMPSAAYSTGKSQSDAQIMTLPTLQGSAPVLNGASQP